MEVKFLYQRAIGQLKLVKWSLMEKFSPGLKRSIICGGIYLCAQRLFICFTNRSSMRWSRKFASKFARPGSSLIRSAWSVWWIFFDQKVHLVKNCTLVHNFILGKLCRRVTRKVAQRATLLAAAAQIRKRICIVSKFDIWGGRFLKIFQKFWKIFKIWLVIFWPKSALRAQLA